MGKLDDDNQGKHFQIDMISHQKFEDMFYDPVACRPFYKDKEAPVWFGRVEGLSAVNQKLFVYGFVDSADEVKGLSLEYSMQMRGKNHDEELWNYLNEDEPYLEHQFNCNGPE